MYKQVIIARKDLHMSSGKLAAQVSHASMAFLSKMISANTVKIWDNRFSSFLDPSPGDGKWSYVTPTLNELAKEARDKGEKYFYASRSNTTGDYKAAEPRYHYETRFDMDVGIYEEWLTGIFTKVVLQARNKSHLLKARTMANELAMIENQDYFLIYDCCNTELVPENEDGRTLTAIGFKPMPEEVIDKIGRKYHTYMDASYNYFERFNCNKNKDKDKFK